MDIQTIEDEINLFNMNFFEDVAEVCEEGLDFISNNHLHQPKENYTLLYKFSNTLFSHFKSLDYLIIDDTLSKLQKDIFNLNYLYSNLKEMSSDIKNICTSQVLKKSKLIQSIEDQLQAYKKITNISVTERKTLKSHFSNYEKLRIVYFKLFKEIFIEEREYFLSSLLNILNTKIYYFEKLLWVKAAQSETILRSLKDISINGEIGSKYFLAHKLKVIMPYSKDYIYFRKCLRIFK